MINIVGLGPSDYKDLTLRAVEIMNNGCKNYLRTNSHQAVKYFEKNHIEYDSFDYLYEISNSFDEVYEKIVKTLLDSEKKYGEINYFVPGDPNVAEKTVKLLLNEDVNINLNNAMSFIEPVVSAVGIDIADGFKFLDSDFNIYDLEPDKDIIITQVYNNFVLSDCLLKIAEVYTDEKEIVFIKDAGLKSEVAIKKKIKDSYSIDEINHQSSIFIPKGGYGMVDLLKELENSLFNFSGLDFDRDFFEKLSHILNFNSEMEDKILDNFLLSLYYIMQYNRTGLLNYSDTISKFREKIKENGDFLLNYVENNHFLGYNYSSLNEDKKAFNQSFAIEKAKAVIDEAVKINFMWNDYGDIKEVLISELDELQEAIDKNSNEDIIMELGDVLFTALNISKFLNLDAEESLFRSAEKFEKRLKAMKEFAQNTDIVLDGLSLEQLDDIYNKTKN